MVETLEPTIFAFATGVLSGSSAAFFGSLGDNCIRAAHFKENLRPEDSRRPNWKRPLFLFGNFCSIALNPVFSAIGASLVGNSVTSPLSSLHNVFNIILSYLILGEPITNVSLFGTSVLILGALCVIYASDKTASLLPIEVMVDNLSKTPALIYLCTVVGLAFISFLIARSNRVSPQKHVIPFLAYSLLPGLCGGISNAFLKFVIASSKQKEWMYLAMFAACAITGAVSQIVSLNIGLRKIPTVRIVPVYTSSLMILGSWGGMAIFREHPEHIPVYLVGFSLLVSGVVVMALAHHGGKDKDSAADPELMESVLRVSAAASGATCGKLPDRQTGAVMTVPLGNDVYSVYAAGEYPPDEHLFQAGYLMSGPELLRGGDTFELDDDDTVPRVVNLLRLENVESMMGSVVGQTIESLSLRAKKVTSTVASQSAFMLSNNGANGGVGSAFLPLSSDDGDESVGGYTGPTPQGLAAALMGGQQAAHAAMVLSYRNSAASEYKSPSASQRRFFRLAQLPEDPRSDAELQEEGLSQS